ncbi:30S ribosomal protein S3 [Ihubacter sp. rT4E-8]|uniref:30S ribosomal protein S3 n=1 Tax=unclassified Ihubacter TaxID=2633299 RepID=UPI00137AA696
MGQKVSPHGLRVGVIKDWNSKWYAKKNNFADLLVEDNQVREYVKKKLYVAGVSKVVIERAAANKIRVIVLTARPGMVIGRSGNGVDELKAALVKMTGKEVEISIEEVRRAELDAQLTAESIAQALERRVSFRRAMKQAIGRTMKAGAKGIKVLCSGRLGGAEIARSEKYSEGNVPLHTLRADIDYGFAEADTTYGKIGVKVWINHGEILDKGLQSPVREEKREKRERRGRKDGDRRRNDRRDRGDRRRNDRGDRNEAPKAVNPRVRKTPKAEPKAIEPQVEAAPAAETTEE